MGATPTSPFRCRTATRRDSNLADGIQRDVTRTTGRVPGSTCRPLDGDLSAVLGPDRSIDALAAFADEPSRAELVERLCDTRQVTIGSEILSAFCAVFAIKNARTSFDDIERDDHRDDLDVDTNLDRIG